MKTWEVTKTTCSWECTECTGSTNRFVWLARPRVLISMQIWSYAMTFVANKRQRPIIGIIIPYLTTSMSYVIMQRDTACSFSINTLHRLSLAKLVCKASWKLAIWSWSAFLKPTPTWMGSILLPRPSGIMTPQRVKSLVVLSTVSLLAVPASKQFEPFQNTSLNTSSYIAIHTLDRYFQLVTSSYFHISSCPACGSIYRSKEVVDHLSWCLNGRKKRRHPFFFQVNYSWFILIPVVQIPLRPGEQEIVSNFEPGIA